MSNNPSDLFDLTMGNIMDNFYDSAMNTSTDGTFKAVCLSGIQTEDNTGEGTDDNDGQLVDGYMNVIVRPFTDFGDILPDPRDFSTPEEINSAISMHTSMFLARSDYGFAGANPISFGQIVECYFERGSIVNSDFRTLRFKEPQIVEIELSYQQLSTIEGVQTLGSLDWASSTLLGPNPFTEKGKTSNPRGPFKKPIQYIVIHYSAAVGTKERVLRYENESTQFGYHYMVDRDGSYLETLEPTTIVWHAEGNKTVNNGNSIGVCLMNAGYARENVPAKSDWVTGNVPNSSGTNQWEPYTEESLDTAAGICANLLKQFGLTIDAIVGHSDIQKNKQDPGPAFGMVRFKLLVSQKLKSLG